MLKKITITAAAVILLLTAFFLGSMAYKTESYIESLESELNVALTVNDRLEHELSVTKEQLRISNDKLEKLAMKQESEQALELMKGEEQ